LRPIAEGRPTPLTSDSTAVEIHPQWSRDGARILYIKDGLVFSALAGGGAPRQEVPARGNVVESATWSPDNRRIAYVAGDTLFVHGEAGTSRPLAVANELSLCTWGPRDLIACSEGNRLYILPGLGFGNIAPSWITVIRVRDGGMVTVTDSTASNQSPQWSEDGSTLLYLSNRLGLADIYALPIGDDGTARGEPERLTVGLNVSTFSLAAEDGRLAYAVMTSTSNVWSQPWTGGLPPAEVHRTQVTFGQQVVENFALSKDGVWLFYDSDLAGNSDIYRISLTTGVPERLTSDRTPEFAPDPSPDGRYVAFHSFRGASRDIYVLPLDGGALERVTSSPTQEGLPNWSPDGERLVYFTPAGQGRVEVASRGVEGSWQLSLRLASGGFWSRWSPDGQSIAFTTALLGGGLRVMPADSGTPRSLYDERQPGAPIAETSLWSDDGRTLYFKSHTASGAASIWAVPASGGTARHLLDLGDDRFRSDRYGFRIAKGQLYYTLYDRQSNIWVMELER
jgi:Tol biopolymer transport system component